MRRNMYLPSSPTCTHPNEPPCTHRSVHCVRSINDISTLCQQYLTRVGIECRPLRAHQDRVSTDGQHQRFASPFHPPRQLDQKRSQNLPETGVPEMMPFSPQKGQEKPRSPPHSTPHNVSFAFHPSTFVHPTASDGVSE